MRCPLVLQVVEGMDVVREVEKVGDASGTPSKPVTITACGVLGGGELGDVQAVYCRHKHQVVHLHSMFYRESDFCPDA